MNPSVETWNAVYDNDTAPWVIGEPQPAIVALERAGWIRGRVLDPAAGPVSTPSCSPAWATTCAGWTCPQRGGYARRNAAAQGVPQARFDVADALRLAESGHSP